MLAVEVRAHGAQLGAGFGNGPRVEAEVRPFTGPIGVDHLDVEVVDPEHGGDHAFRVTVALPRTIGVPQGEGRGRPVVFDLSVADIAAAQPGVAGAHGHRRKHDDHDQWRECQVRQRHLRRVGER